jgi:hypothetical protein
MLNFKDSLRVKNNLIKMYYMELGSIDRTDKVYIEFIKARIAKVEKSRNLLLCGKP